MDKDLISVVMSVYNAENYLKESIESILKQTYKNFEFIIINDGSTDKSLKIIENYAKKDNRIVVISRENRGLVESLNEGIKKAKGKYIARMDADDISLLNRFEKQIEFLETHPHVGIVGSAVVMFGKNIKDKIWKLPTKDSMIKSELLFAPSLAHPTVMLRRDLLIAYNLSYDREFLHAEDHALWTALSKVTKMANLPIPLLKYRISDDSISHQADNAYQSRFKIIKKIFGKYLTDLNIQNTSNEDHIHFDLTHTSRLKMTSFKRDDINRYLDKLLRANDKEKVFNKLAFKMTLGKKWLWFVYLHRDIRGLMSKYTFYGIWAILTK